MSKKNKHPYNYKSYGLKNGGSATFTGKPTKEMIEAVNAMADLARDIGCRKWHRIFGWVTITHPYSSNGKTLVDSEYKHVQQYINGKGWIDYVGTGKNGNIVSIYVHKDELFNEPQNDPEQGLINMVVKVLS